MFRNPFSNTFGGLTLLGRQGNMQGMLGSQRWGTGTTPQVTEFEVSPAEMKYEICGDFLYDKTTGDAWKYDADSKEFKFVPKVNPIRLKLVMMAEMIEEVEETRVVRGSLSSSEQAHYSDAFELHEAALKKEIEKIQEEIKKEI